MSDEPFRPLVVACVEDDASVAEALEGLLLAFGFAPEIYSSGEAFLSGARLDRLSCLLVDVELGGMSGVDLVRRLGELQVRIPAIVVTAFDNERTRRLALEAGAVAFLRKPVDGGDLMASIASALRGGQNV